MSRRSSYIDDLAALVCVNFGSMSQKTKRQSIEKTKIYELLLRIKPPHNHLHWLIRQSQYHSIQTYSVHK